MIKQYVNLPYDAPKNHGGRLLLEATAAKLSDDDVGLTEWWIESDPKNIDIKYLSRIARSRLGKLYVSNMKNIFRNKIYLPHVGGDKYIVKCSKKGDRSAAVVVDEIETWRKIFYTVHYMNASCLGMFNKTKDRIEKAFKDGFVEFELKNTTPTLRDEPKTETGDVFTLYRSIPALQDKPFHLRVIVLNDVFDYEEKYYEYDFSGVAAINSTIRTLNPMSDGPANHWCVSLTAQIVGTNAEVDIKNLAIKTNKDTVSIDFSKNATILSAIQNGKIVKVKITTMECEGFCGFSYKNLCVVRINERMSAADTEITVLQTFTHEVGHGLQQVVRKERIYDAAGKGIDWEENDKWHNDNFGGQGPHCRTNTKEVKDVRKIKEGRTKSGKLIEHDNGVLCTMFYSAHYAVDENGMFCESCLPRLKRASLSSSKMKTKGWDEY